jgi:uncharacterized RDD family membrane protein YckC
VTGIVTPEAVRLEFEPAGVATRMLGLFIDLAVQLAALLALFVVVGLLASDLSESGAVILTVVGLFLVLFGYPIGCESLWRGRTLGKAALGLRVRTREGAPVRFRHAAIRGAIGFVELYVLLGVPATISVLVTRDSQRLGDLAAGTLVLRERSASTATASAFAFHPPPGWEPYTASLDVGAMTADQYGLVRGFLLRANELTPPARSHLAVRLANPLAEVLRHQPPPGVHPESFLHCAAAAYQRRHGGAERAAR